MPIRKHPARVVADVIGGDLAVASVIVQRLCEAGYAVGRDTGDTAVEIAHAHRVDLSTLEEAPYNTHLRVVMDKTVCGEIVIPTDGGVTPRELIEKLGREFAAMIVETLEAQKVATFPVMRHGGGRVGTIPWPMIAPHEHSALANHGQTLTRLAQRGGLTTREIVAVLEHVPVDAIAEGDGNRLPGMVQAWRERHPDVPRREMVGDL